MERGQRVNILNFMGHVFSVTVLVFLQPFKKVKIIDKSLAWLIKKKILWSQITNRNEIEITTETMEIQKKKKSYENSTNCYMPTNRATEKKWTNIY